VRLVGDAAPATQMAAPAAHALVAVVGLPQVVAFAHVGAWDVSVGTPAAFTAQASGGSLQLAGVFAALPHPVVALHVAVYVVSWPAAQAGAEGLHEVATGVAAPQVVPLAHAGVYVVNTGPFGPFVHASGVSGQLVAAFAVRAHPVVALHVGVYVVSLPAAHLGFPGAHAVAVGAAGPQLDPSAQAGVYVVKTGPLAPVVHVSAVSGQAVGAFAARAQPLAAVHVGVYGVSMPAAHVVLPGAHAVADSETPQAGGGPPLQMPVAPEWYERLPWAADPAHDGEGSDALQSVERVLV
jgi:hypothetical protein